MFPPRRAHAHSSSFARSPPFSAPCSLFVYGDFLTPPPTNSGYPGVPRHSPFPPPHLVFTRLRGAVCMPSPNFFTGFTCFLSQASAESWQLTPAPSVQLSRRPVQPGESPAGPGRAGAVRAGTREARPPPGALFSLVPPRTFPPTKWGRQKAERANQVRLQSPR